MNKKIRKRAGVILYFKGKTLSTHTSDETEALLLVQEDLADFAVRFKQFP